MKSLRFLDRRVGSLLAAFALLTGVVVPSVLPAFASAATLTARSIAMSSSATAATGVQYTVTFTTSAATYGTIIDWCSDSPIVATACTTATGNATGMSVASATTAFTSTGSANIPGGTVSTTGTSQYHTAIAGTSASSGAGTWVFTLSGVTNPTGNPAQAGSFYARIYTYSNSTNFASYVSPTNPGTTLDTGGVALSTTTPIAVSAAVKETMTFCVSGSTTAPTSTCTGLLTPALTLGHGTPAALDSTATDTGLDYAQISTNASGGAAVFMTNSNTSCGGLRRNSAGATVCDIGPQVAAGTIAPGTATFGLNVGTQSTLAGGSGTIVAQAPYSTASQYGMNWVSGNATGVGSTYGDKIFTTNNAPISNVNVPLTFAASVTNSTPAGLYSANINLVATGTF